MRAEPSALFLDTELYIDGSARDPGAVGESESVGDGTLHLALSNADMSRRKQSLAHPRRLRKIALPEIKSA